jgi:uncharacterized UPF0160 family protein
MLLKLLPRFHKHAIVRTRNEAVMKTAEVCVDVGLVYDPQNLRFDHHQNEFTQTFELRPTLLSSAGLIYRHFGMEILRNMHPSLAAEDLPFIYHRTYCVLVEGIDAMDNGVSPCKGDQAYRDHTGLASDISRMNMTASSLRLEDEVFEEAMDYSRSTLESIVQYLRDEELPASKFVHTALENRKHYSSTGQILVLQKDCPWVQTVDQFNRNRVQVLFCVHPRGDHWEVVQITQERQTESLDIYQMCRRLPGVLTLRRDFASGSTSTQEAALELATTLLDLRRRRLK